MPKIMTVVFLTVTSLMVSACAMHGTWGFSAVNG